VKPKIPFPIEGPFIFVISTGRIIAANLEEGDRFSFPVNGKTKKFKKNDIKNKLDLELFLNDLELYYFLKERGILENYNLEEWESEIYILENLWLYDKNPSLSEREIKQFYEEYNQLGRIKGLLDWKAWSAHENNDLIKGFKKKENKSAFKKAIEKFDEVIEPGVAIAVMPSSQKNQWGVVGEAAKELCQKKERIDCSELFFRFEDIGKQQGLPAKDRVPETHFNSIRLNRKYLVLEKKYYILDDVITTGVSLNSVKTMLKLAGINRIRVMALGNTLLS